jgi:quinol monooxygenase YgiN
LNYYVYYKIAPERSGEVQSLVKALFAELEKQTGIRGRWMRRRDDPTTYMEVYEDVKEDGEAHAAFEALLAREGARFGVQRKVERFISAETPA